MGKNLSKPAFKGTTKANKDLEEKITNKNFENIIDDEMLLDADTYYELPKLKKSDENLTDSTELVHASGDGANKITNTVTTIKMELDKGDDIASYNEEIEKIGKIKQKWYHRISDFFKKFSTRRALYDTSPIPTNSPSYDEEEDMEEFILNELAEALRETNISTEVELYSAESSFVTAEVHASNDSDVEQKQEHDNVAGIAVDATEQAVLVEVKNEATIEIAEDVKEVVQHADQEAVIETNL